MTTELTRQARSAAQATDRQQPADALVVFGITGDLAKVMTFTSLYRLERRGLLACPIVGVAVNDWTVGRVGGPARAGLQADGGPLDDEVFARLPGRPSPRFGDVAERDT